MARRLGRGRMSLRVVSARPAGVIDKLLHCEPLYRWGRAERRRGCAAGPAAQPVHTTANARRSKRDPTKHTCASHMHTNISEERSHSARQESRHDTTAHSPEARRLAAESFAHPGRASVGPRAPRHTMRSMWYAPQPRAVRSVPGPCSQGGGAPERLNMYLDKISPQS